MEHILPQNYNFGKNPTEIVKLKINHLVDKVK